MPRPVRQQHYRKRPDRREHESRQHINNPDVEPVRHRSYREGTGAKEQKRQRRPCGRNLPSYAHSVLSLFSDDKGLELS